MADKEKGTIDTDSLEKLLSREKVSFEDECDEVFKMLDYDKKGYINKPKLKAIAQNLCKVQVACFFHSFREVSSLTGNMKLTDQEADEMIYFYKSEAEGVSRKDFLELQREYLKQNKIL